MRSVKMTEYRLRRYFYSSRPVIPLLIIVCFVAIMYSVKPMDICRGYLISGMVQFILMTFVALSMNGNEEAVEEQLLLLRGHGWGVYCMARELTLLVISCFYGILITIGPVIVNCINQFSFFTRDLSVADVGLGAMIVLGSGLAGIAIGDALHPGIMRDRKLAVALVVGILILSVAKDAIIGEYGFFRVFGILFPSVMKPARDLGNEIYFEAKSVLAFLLMMVLYYLVVTVIKNLVLSRKKFS